MPGSIPELSDIGPQLEGGGLYGLREEVQRLLNRRTVSFPGAQPVSLLKRHFEVLKNEEYVSCKKMMRLNL
jgi:mRNA guanylyltransferase